MKIVLLYPPPWKIAPFATPNYPPGQGPPAGFDDAAITSGDFLQIPYGLISLAAQARRSRMDVDVFNLANAPWPAVESFVHRTRADLFGLSCMTANRRGTAMVAQLIRDIHPSAHITVGGPHVTALPMETLTHVPAVDTVVVGEGETTFMALARRMAAGKPVSGLAGTAWRHNGRCHVAPPRPAIENMDSLAAPHDYFDTSTVLTSRGCPNRCTFCGSSRMWGRRVRYHSAPYVLNMLETAVNRHDRRFIAFKDDTFTADRRRILKICKGIGERGLKFVWSCDTRVDCLDEKTLAAMRRAGCVRISLGVESGSPVILKNIRKHFSLDKLAGLTETIQALGMEVRYYMMVGNRGETVETFLESLSLMERTRPNRFVFSQLHLYPGTEEFDIFCRHGHVTPEIFFTRDFFCLTCFAGDRHHEKQIREMLTPLAGVRTCREFGVTDRLATLARFPDLHLSHVDLCRACLKAGDPDAAEHHLRRALDLGFFLPGLAHNLLACIAAQRGDADQANAHLDLAVGHYPHAVVVENLQRLDAWRAAGAKNGCPKLAPGDGFESTCILRQPEFPDPIESACPAPVNG
ncbi:MAG: cobalamin-dependent protein [Desulfobacterales bacterium]|nr:cobalamin-dependent protein [Desulfobacterales bacterium]